MEEDKIKNQNTNEEKELLEEANIVVRKQDGSFSVVSGKNLLGQEEAVSLKKPPAPPKPAISMARPAAASKPVPKLKVVFKKPVTKEPPTPAVASALPQPAAAPKPVPKKPSPASQTTVSISKPAFEPEKPVGVGKASFFFDTEDEQEIQKIKEGQGDRVNIDLNAIIDRIITESNVSFGDEILNRRLRSLIASRLKDVRTPAQFLEALETNAKIGGIGLKEAQADTIVKLTQEESSKIQTGRVKLPKLQDVREKRAEEERKKTEELDAVKKMIAQRQEQAAKESSKTAPKTPFPEKKQLPKKQAEPEPVPRSKAEPLQPRLKEESGPFDFPKVKRQDKEGTRTRMADIKTPPRVLGPVEELRTINLSEFRQLGANPEVCTRKIEEKVMLLEEDSLTQKAEGIIAWKQSEVYRLYLDIGNDSMAQGKSVQEVIESRSLEGKPALSGEEFNAIADLNKRLRF